MIRSILSAALIVAAAAATASESDRNEITLGEQSWTKAYLTGDADPVAAFLDDRFRGVRANGTVHGKAEELDAIRKEPHDSSGGITDLDIQFHGDTAVALVREKIIGPAPEFKPYWRTITDTWIKTNGRWKAVATEELDPGAPTQPDHQADSAKIMELRAASNRAIATHDMGAFLPYFAEDAVFVWSNGSSAIGKAGLQTFFARDFADPAFVAYIRTPERVSVSETGVRGVEHGTWTAIKREPRGETLYGGDYMAHWFKTPEGWQIRGEVYVKLRCAGPLCTP